MSKFTKWHLITLFLFCFLNTSLSTTLAANESNSNNSTINFNVKKVVLPSNGLTILLNENHKLPLTTFTTFYKVGSRNETPGITGSTHFLEHLMFKGAKKYGPGQFDSIIEGNGGNTNAYTSYDLTVYHQEFPASLLEKIIDLEADRMSNLLLEPTSFEQERKVILEERKLRYENSPHGKLYLKVFETMFQYTPYESSVIGAIPDIESVTREEVLNYFKKFYAPNNALISIVGDFKSDEVIKLMEKYYGAIPASKELQEQKEHPSASMVLEKNSKNPGYFPSEKTWDKVEKINFGQDLKIYGNAKNTIFYFAFRGKKIGESESYALDLLSAILGSGDSSYFAQKYVHSSSPILSSINVTHHSLISGGIFTLQGEILNNTSFDKIKKLFLKDFDNVCEKAITKTNIEKAKNQFLLSYLDSIKTNHGVAQFLSNFEYYYGDYSFYKKEMAIYQGLSEDEVRNSCLNLFKEKKFNTYSLSLKYKK